jgi:hypothetical protein
MERDAAERGVTITELIKGAVALDRHLWNYSKGIRRPGFFAWLAFESFSLRLPALRLPLFLAAAAAAYGITRAGIDLVSWLL